jgi:hypothetical protein
MKGISLITVSLVVVFLIGLPFIAMGDAYALDEITDSDITEFYTGHENKSKRRVVAFQKNLDSMADSDESALKALRNRLEIQLTIEELIFKSREAEHVKWELYTPIVASIVAIVISVLALFLRK